MAIIKLKNPILGVRPFEKSHAERILTLNDTLKLKEGDRWELTDTKLSFKDGVIISSRGTANNTAAEEQG